MRQRTDGQGKGTGSNDGSRSAGLCRGSSVTAVGVMAEDMALGGGRKELVDVLGTTGRVSVWA